MAKQLNDIRPVGDDDDEVPELDMNKPLGVQANARIVGKVDLPDEERKVARPLGLDIISPDPTQPRREVPPVVRKLAREQGIPEWEQWHQMAEHQAGYEINLKSLLRGEGDGIETEKTGAPLVDGFMSLVALAASIYDKGLVNPITVSARGAGYTIETGERRYQAYKLLYGVLGHKKFSRIAANVVPAVDVWRQAAENGSRKPLNAIGMARQIALLVMALNTDKTYAPFESFEGKSDREFYAQVADGNIHRIPKGTSERILQATGMKSRSQIANHRALLDISDDLWTQADEDDWTEGRIREHVLSQKRPDTFTTVNVSTPHTPMTVRKGDGPGTKPNPTNTRVLYKGREVEVYDYTARTGKPGLEYLIYHLDSNGLRTYTETVQSHQTDDLPHPERGIPTGGLNPANGIDYDRLPRQPYPASPQAPTPSLAVGQLRRNQQGKTFEVRSVLNGLCSVVEISPSTGKPISNAFSMNAVAVSQMALVTTDAPVFNAETVERLEVDKVYRHSDPHHSGEWFYLYQITERDSDYLVQCYMVDAQGNRMNNASFTFRPDDLALDRNHPYPATADNPPSTNPDDEDAPPDWAARGKTILHKPSNTICRVEGVSWDVIENCWYVRVKSGEGEWADLRVSECIPAIEEAASIAPVEKHPALNPHNALSVITEMQFELEYLRVMAVSYKMPAEADLITRMKALTPKALDTFLIDKGEDGALAELETMWRACDAVTTRARTTMNTVCNEAIEVLRQKADEKRAS